VLQCEQIVDTERYPINNRNSPLRSETVDNVRQQLAQDGCAVIRNFFSNAGIKSLLQEAVERLPEVYYSPNKACNVYLGAGDPSLPADHPRNVFLERSNGFITADLFDPGTACQRLYHWQALCEFLAECLQKEHLHIYADPISNMIVNVGKTGQRFNWHYDTNEFTITMLLQGAESGGQFQYVPGLRSAADECYGDVARVLQGDDSRVRKLELNPGDLQFFLGRYSLHQVTENTGAKDRLLLIMSFTEQPGVIGSRTRVKDLYGKVSDAHLGDQNALVRSDGLLD